MKPIIRIKLDVTKIDKSALFKGSKGTYLDLSLVPTSSSQYGDDYMVTQDIGKERRQAGEKGPILGNAKILETQGGGRQQPAKPLPTRPAQAKPEQEIHDDDAPLPF
jgi:hypothetical protein